MRTGVVAVFVPGLMGAGILLSGVILAVDLARRLFPQLGLRRRIATARGVHGVAAAAARAAGCQGPTGLPFARMARSRWVYAAVAAACGALAGLAIRTGVATYVAPGILHRNPWSIAMAVAAALPPVAVGGVSLMLALLHERGGRLAGRLVARTWLGRTAIASVEAEADSREERGVP